MALYFVEVLSSALNARLTSLDGERNADWLHEEPPPLSELCSITGLDVRDHQACLIWVSTSALKLQLSCMIRHAPFIGSSRGGLF